MRWISGHPGITGNEETDKLARAALNELSPETSTEFPRDKKRASIHFCGTQSTCSRTLREGGRVVVVRDQAQ